MDLRIIKSPSQGTKDLLKRRMGFYGKNSGDFVDMADAVGLVQGKMIDMVCASDIAEKASGVEVYDVKGLCPQHMTLLAIFGDTSSVKAAMSEIEDKVKEGTYSDYRETY
ncbi:MAG: BMC domain-containing protein [Clostridiales bacterium]|nr:BMC domain-containing protein [Clostridiales bacterium]MDD7347622.1 BMC domain-containing protein [Clostridiales bacterium]MDY4061044.1 BMC domain-containing protein [Anaerovoracaceae bacterium]